MPRAIGENHLPMQEVVVEYFTDHDILHPPQEIKRIAYRALRTGDPMPEEHIARADQALSAISLNFHDWMTDETEKLVTARGKYHSQGVDSDARQTLFQAAHDVRGNGGVFGFPLAGRVADSLCKLLAQCPASALPSQIVDQHVDAIRAMVREEARGHDNPKARDLALKLIAVTEEYLAVVAPEGSENPSR